MKSGEEAARNTVSLFMVFQFHNPTKTCLSIGTDEFTAIAIVGRVLTRTRESESKKVPIEGEKFRENDTKKHESKRQV